MPAGIPVGTLAIGKAGAVNAALLAAAVLALSDERLAARLEAFRKSKGADTVTVQVERAAGVKCERCWRYVAGVSSEPALGTHSPG